MRPHVEIAEQPGTWKALLVVEYKDTFFDPHAELTATVWSPDRSYEMTGFDSYVEWNRYDECDDLDGHMPVVAERTIDEHTTARMSFFIC